MDKTGLINSLVEKLKKIENISAIVIGGSHATGTNRPDSDIDFGLYYRDNTPFNIDDIRNLANSLNDEPEPLVSDFEGWGHWVNGGTWLTIKGQRVDFIYRNLDFVEKIIDNCIEGKIESDYYQEPPTGFHSYIYCAEIKANKILYDTENIIEKLKKKIEFYPLKLKTAIINKFLWDSEFTLSRANKFALRGEIYLTASSLTRIAHDLTQVIYALNETYFLSEKKVYTDLLNFKKIPIDYIKTVENTLRNPGSENKQLLQSLEVFNILIEEFKTVSKNIYTPKYNK